MGYKTWAAGDVLTASDLMTYLMKQAVIVCTSGTRPSTPVAGMVIYETDTHNMLVYDGSWTQLASRQIGTTGDSEGGTYTITTTTFDITTTGGTYADCGTNWIAPYSGNVVLHWAAEMQNSAAGSSTFVSPETRDGAVLGSGTVIAVAADSTSVKSTGTLSPRFGASRLITGLTGGASYNTRLLHRVDGGTGTIRSRNLVIQAVT